MRNESQQKSILAAQDRFQSAFQILQAGVDSAELELAPSIPGIKDKGNIMDKKQAETVADALLAPGLERQAAVEQRRTGTQRMMNIHRRRGAYGFVGFLLGGLAGYFIAGSLIPAVFIGLVAGMLVGYVFVKAERPGVDSPGANKQGENRQPWQVSDYVLINTYVRRKAGRHISEYNG